MGHRTKSEPLFLSQSEAFRVNSVRGVGWTTAPLLEKQYRGIHVIPRIRGLGDPDGDIVVAVSIGQIVVKKMVKNPRDVSKLGKDRPSNAE